MDDRPLIKPKRLKPGDTLGVVVPSSPFDQDLFDKGLARIEQMGFRVALARGAFDHNGYLAGSDENRADQILRFFADPKISGIICARGGYGSLRLLSLIDFDRVRQHPKVFVGFSDATVLLSSFYRRSGLACFHGPMVTTLGHGADGSAEALAAALTGDQRLQISCRDGETICPGTATGPVCGGNLTVLCHLLGTPFAPAFGGHILFLEDVGEAPYRIDRMLTQMRLAGALQGVRAVVLGDFENCGEPGQIHQIVDQAFSGGRTPILAGLSAGHGNTNLTLPIGPIATLDANRMVLEYQEQATEE
ncbi:MAG: LD-carboxypeptidase [Desulfobacterales bacterium]|jgi:muramoyltetrapeptide carboxypeptidase